MGMLKFIEDAGKLKKVKRAGWGIRGVKEPESVAEHSFRTALVAMLLADAEGLDAEVAVKMALLHDLQECIVGDITRKSPNYNKKKELERKAIEELLRELPEDLAIEYLDAWKEYEEGKTPEAKLVKQADKLEMLIQAAEYERQGYKVKDFWDGEYNFEGLALEMYGAMKKRRK